jgi:hypothetical protein
MTTLYRQRKKTIRHGSERVRKETGDIAYLVTGEERGGAATLSTKISTATTKSFCSQRRDQYRAKIGRMNGHTVRIGT